MRVSELLNSLEKNKIKDVKKFEKDVYKDIRQKIMKEMGSKEDVEDLYQNAILQLLYDVNYRYKDDQILLNAPAKLRILKYVRLSWMSKYPTKKVEWDDSLLNEIPTNFNEPEIDLFATAEIEIAEKWTMHELGNFILNLNTLYKLQILSRILSYSPLIPASHLIDNLEKTFIKEIELRVVKLKYNSPGIISISGIAVGLKKLKNLLFIKEERESKRLDNELKKEELRRKRLENVEMFLTLAKKSKLPISEINKLSDFIDDKKNSITNLIKEGKIIDLKINE